VSRYQKGKTNLDFTEARDSEWQWCQLGHMQVCTSLQADNHASTPPLSLLQAGCPSCRPTNSVKALNAPVKLLVGKFSINLYLSQVITTCDGLRLMQQNVAALVDLRARQERLMAEAMQLQQDMVDFCAATRQQVDSPVHSCISYIMHSLQCFNTVGCASGRAFGL